jgi:DHA2 family multidrug resistance protein-like MFS transporter
VYLGLGPVFTLGTDLIVGAAPPERAGAAAAISETSSEFGGALGIALLGSVGTAIYRSRMANAVLEGIPAEVGRAARETLGGAAAAAEHLAEPLKAELLAASREAFTHALEQTAAICALVAAATAVMSVVLLRRIRSAGSDRSREPVADAALAQS